MKRKAITYRRTAIKRPGRLKVRARTAVSKFKTVTHMGSTFVVDMSKETAMKVEHAIGRRMFICFGRTNCLESKEFKALMPERIAYLRQFKKTIAVSNQTLSTTEERHALLGDVKIYG